MQMKKTYKGYKDGVYGIYCGFKPKGLENVEEVEVYYPDEGYTFMKDNKEFSVVILREGEEIGDYQEVELPEKEEELPE